MATLNATLTLTSSDIVTGQSLSLSLADALGVLGPVLTKRIAIASAEDELLTDQTILAAASYTKSYVLLYNTSAVSGDIISIGLASNDGTGDGALDYVDMLLGPLEFAFFPWSSTVNMVADAAQNSPVLEVRVFQAAA